MPPGRLLLIGGSILLWLVALLVLLVLFGMGEEAAREPVFGSLEGRFESDVTMALDGRTLHYRENEITNYLFIGVDKEDVTQLCKYGLEIRYCAEDILAHKKYMVAII